VSFAQSFVEAATNSLLLSLPAYRLLATLSMRLQPSNLRKLNLWFSCFSSCYDFPLGFVAARYGDASRAADKKLLITSNENRHGTDEIAAGHRVGTAIIMPR